MGRPYLYKISFLRGVAILLVFTYHSQRYLFPNFEINEYAPNNILLITGLKNNVLNFSPTAFGWSGVQLFLLISGFLIHLGYLTNQTKFDCRSFFSRRFWRIYPPYLLVLLFLIFASGRFPYYLFTFNGIKDTLSHLLLLHNLSDETIYSINPSFWSLALEAQLYLLYPLLLKIRTRAGMGKAFIMILTLSFALLIIGIAFPQIGKSVAFGKSAFQYWFIWVAGALLAEKYSKNEIFFKTRALEVSILLFMVGIISKIYLYTSHLTVYLITFSLFVFFEWFMLEKKIDPKSIIVKTISIIGICSYSIYLIHQPYLPDLLNFFVIIKSEYWTKYFIALRLIPIFIIIFLISYSLYLFVERPSIQIGKMLRNKLNS